MAKYKIGIITHYYRSKNYGGNLQAFALEKIVNGLGYNAEQISYNMNRTLKIKIKFVLDSIKRIKKGSSVKKEIVLIKSIHLRNRAFNKFNKKEIKHSKKVFSKKTIKKSNKLYDCFIVGSDQVWNLNCLHSAFFLDFTSNEKKRISYAASLSMSELTEIQKQFFKKEIYKFDYISVREKKDAELLQLILDKKINHVLDPTLLISYEEWKKYIPKRLIKEKYMFCFFLGDDKNNRKISKIFADMHSIKIVSMPNMVSVTSVDSDFGDYSLYEISPFEFLSLIYYADFIFTDSFHANVFSYIFGKEFYIFNRHDNDEMSGRIYNINFLFKTLNRYCNQSEKKSLEYLDSLIGINYEPQKNIELNQMKFDSIEFLKESLGEKNTNA